MKKDIKSNQNSVQKAMYCFLSLGTELEKAETIRLQKFNKVVVSPHIEVILKESDEHSVVIESCKVPINKLKVEVQNETLNVYIVDAKAEVDLEREQSLNWEDASNYSETMAKVIINYKNIAKIAFVGEEKFTFLDAITKSLRLKMIGRTKVYINQINAATFSVTLFGQNTLQIKSGTVKEQDIVTFGEDVIQVAGVATEKTKIKALGAGVIECNVSKKLRVTTLGEASIKYKGNAKVSKGFMIGNSTIQQL